MAPKNQSKGSGSKGSAPARTNAGVNPMAGARPAPAPAPAASMQISQPNGNPIVTQAPARPSHVQASYVDAGSGQSFNTRFVPGAMQPGQVGYDSNTGGGVWTAGGMSDEEIRAFYRSSNPLDGGGDSFISMSGKPASAFTLEGLYGNGTATLGAPTTGGKAASRFQDAQTLGQGLRIAGSNGNVSKGELQKLTNKFDVGADKVVRRLDKVNTNTQAKGRGLKIGLGSGAVSSLVNMGNTYTSGMFRESQFGTGNVGKTLQEYINASNPTGGFQNPRSGSSSYKPVKGAMGRAAAQSAAGLIPLQRGGAYQINSKGGYSPKASNPGVNRTAASPVNTQDGDNITTNQSSPGPQTNNSTPQENLPMTPEEMKDASTIGGVGAMSGGGLGAAGASKLGRANSRIRQLGIYGRGTSLLGRGLQYGNVLNK